ncbi:MAG: nuclear transport factor 2 family protein [Acidimicrobiia bacterium]
MIDVETWVESYRRAWEQSDDVAAADLFTEDASYRSNIFESPHLGREGIRSYWRQATSTQREIEVRMGRPILAGRRASVEWWTTMENEGEEITLPGCLLLEFDHEGLCRSLREYYEVAEGRLAPPEDWG